MGGRAGGRGRRAGGRADGRARGRRHRPTRSLPFARPLRLSLPRPRRDQPSAPSRDWQCSACGFASSLLPFSSLVSVLSGRFLSLSSSFIHIILFVFFLPISTYLPMPFYFLSLHFYLFYSSYNFISLLFIFTFFPACTLLHFSLHFISLYFLSPSFQHQHPVSNYTATYNTYNHLHRLSSLPRLIT